MNKYMRKHFHGRYGIDHDKVVQAAIGAHHRHLGGLSSDIFCEPDFLSDAGIDRAAELALQDDGDHGDTRVIEYFEYVQEVYETGADNYG